MVIEKLDKSHFLIQELISSYREDWQYKQGQRDKEKRKYFYMSDVSKCDREIYYLFHHPEKKRTIADKTLMLFRYGNMFHEEAQFRLKKQRVVDNSRDIEYGIEDWEIEATGRLDNFVQDNGKLAVMEIKAKNPYGFLNEEPEQYEVDQLLWYIFAARNSKSLRQRKIHDYGYILYLEGWPISDFPLSGFKIEYNEERIEAIRDRFKSLKVIIEEKKLPKRPYERDSLKCQYCRFREYCWKGVPEPKEPELIPDLSVEKPEMELVQSAEVKYIQIKENMAKEKEELGKLRDLLLRYFQSTGTKETERLTHVFSKRTVLDEDYLLKEAKDVWPFIAKPQISLVKKAIEDGRLDPEIFEKAKKVDFSHSIRIKKGGNHAD